MQHLGYVFCFTQLNEPYTPYQQLYPKSTPQLHKLNQLNAVCKAAVRNRKKAFKSEVSPTSANLENLSYYHSQSHTNLKTHKT